MPFQARLDDLRPGRNRSAAFSDPAGEIVARNLEDVIPAVEKVAAAAAQGLWAVGYVGYEAAPAFDPHLVVRSRHIFHGHLPLLWFGLFKTRRINPGWAATSGSYELSPWELIDSQDHFEQDVRKIRELIIAGDTYQANYTSRLRAHFEGDAMSFYKDLAMAQSGGYGTYLDTGRFQIASASPELFFDRYPGGNGKDKLITRPMKGTARRGRWPAEDALAQQQLERSEKDRAENLIIVDLLRNDLGRIADFGSVQVDELFAIERYDTVWQMTSTISAEVDSDLPLAAVLRGLFPCGSITGAPKVRTMEIIRDLEAAPRGVYTGAIGFVAPRSEVGPRASFSVGIRTVVIDAETGAAEYGIGGGITFGSDPTSEYEEAILKAEILSYGSRDFELLETLRWSPASGWFWLEEHLDRLQTSADYFGVPIDRAAIAARLHNAVVDSPEVRVRLTVDRTGEAKVTAVPLDVAAIGSVAIAVDTDPVDSASQFLFHKTTRRQMYDDRMARHPDADDVLMVNERGQLTESTIANLAVKLDDVWFTPPLDSGCLPGVYRSVLLEEGEIEERAMTLDDLQRCEGLALLNSVRLWRSAFIIDG